MLNVKDGEIEAKVYPGKNAQFYLYEDEGDGYGYETGNYKITKLTWDDTRGQLGKENLKCV